MRGGPVGMGAGVEVRGFRTGDGAALVEAWARAVPHDPITPRWFRDKVLLDANFDPDCLRVAVRGDEILGAAYGVRRLVPMAGLDLQPAQGWIPFFFVVPGARRAGLGRRLVTEVLDRLRDHGCTRVDFSSYTPHYLLPGLDEETYPEAAGLLGGLGFRTLHEVAAMDRTLVGHRMPEKVERRYAELVGLGHRFGTPSDDDLVDLLRLAADEFSADWADAVRRSLAAGTPVERIVAVRAPEGDLVGWAMHGAYDGIGERFGPFGVHARQRGSGLGQVLLHLTLGRMRASGLHGAWFLWTGEDSPAGRLYRGAGFTTTRRFRVLRREDA
ncbi:MAG TPA: GNAT family N-acetyltransferase [Streptomyces sp.]|nr:GNAT family N-acetyltransferase [Streptomyces sp.]